MIDKSTSGIIGGVCSRENVLPRFVAAGKGLLIRRDDADTVSKERGIRVRYSLVASVVNNDRLSWSVE